MSERSIDDIERFGSGGKQEPAPQDATASEPPKAAKPATPEPKAPPQLVDINYPEPTPLAHVIRDVAKWSGQCFVMEPSLNAKIQIFAPRRQVPRDAYELFLASLTVVNLRAVQLGNIVKIVPAGVAVGA